MREGEAVHLLDFLPSDTELNDHVMGYMLIEKRWHFIGVTG